MSCSWQVESPSRGSVDDEVFWGLDEWSTSMNWTPGVGRMGRVGKGPGSGRH